MGNCGVGCAPFAPHMREPVKALLEGVEDIPGPSIDAALDWNWRSFGSYLDQLAARPHAINLAANATHAPIRLLAMGERALDGSAPTDEDIAAMQALLAEALDAGASAFSTDRIALHQLVGGRHVPDWHAPREEVLALVATLARYPGRPMQFAADFGGMVGTEEETVRELSLLEAAAAAGVPVFTPLQQYRVEGGWRRLAAAIGAMNAAGADITFEASARGIGSLMSLELFHPFRRHPSYLAIESLPLDQRLARMREPAFRERLLSEGPTPDPNNAMAIFKFDIMKTHADRIFIAGDRTPDYEPRPSTSVKAIAEREGKTLQEVYYEALTAGTGRNFLYLLVLNYGTGSLEAQREILSLPNTVFSFGDAGAHVLGAACDFANTTFSLIHWGRDRAQGIPLERLVRQMSGAQAKLFGFHDRGRVAVGAVADLNVIDHAGLALRPPEILHDLPGGERRLHQRATGYVATFVEGVAVVEKDELTGAAPGQVLRSR
jgi:N-acyl-D-aspartate/D-glutamate deacylase